MNSHISLLLFQVMYLHVMLFSPAPFYFPLLCLSVVMIVLSAFHLAHIPIILRTVPIMYVECAVTLHTMR
jgi:hypothetical protein